MRKAVTREAIIETAYELIAAEGVQALTLRRLGGHVGVSAPTLLWHIGSRQRLMIYVTDRVFAAIPLPDTASVEALDWLRLAATAIRATLRRQPLLTPLVRDFANWSAAAIDVEVSIFTALENAGFADDSLLRAYTSFTAFVYGYTFLEYAQTVAWSTEEPGVRAAVEDRIAMHSLRALPPTTARLLRREQPRPDPNEELDQHFARGLEALLRGLIHGSQASQAGLPANGATA